MVTTKRQILKDRDRFGGFEVENRSASAGGVGVDLFTAAQPQATETEAAMQALSELPPITAAPEAKTEKPVENAQAAQKGYAAAQPVNYTTPAYKPTNPFFTSAETVAAPVKELPKRPEKQVKPLEHEDVMPSIKTRALASKALESEKLHEDKAAEAEIPARRERAAISPRTKALLIVYIAIALVLAIAVIATGVSISTANAQASALAEEIAQKQSVIAAQQIELADVTNEATIRDEAISRGMVSAGDASVTVNRVEKIDYELATPHTNGFDQFCDWLSDVLM